MIRAVMTFQRLQFVERAAGLRSLRVLLTRAGAGLGLLAAVGTASPAQTFADGSPPAMSTSSALSVNRFAPTMQEQVWEILQPAALGSAPEIEKLGVMIHGLGQEALPVVVGILCGELVDPRTIVRDEDDEQAEPILLPQTLEHQRQILRSALQRWPSDERLQVLVSQGRSGELDRKLAVMELIGEVEGAEAVPALFEVLSGVESLHFESPHFHASMVAALSKTLRSDPLGYAALEKQMPEALPEVLRLVASALGETGSQRGLPILTELVGRDRDTDLVLLRVMGEIAESSPDEPPVEMADLMRSMLFSDDEQIARTAAVGLGKLNDLDSIPLFIQMLDDAGSTRALTALWSLRHMSGGDLPAEPKAWSEWFEGEKTWQLEEGPTLYQALESEDLALVGGALSKLGAHHLYRHESASRIGPMLSSENTDVVRAAIAALQRLGSRRAVPWLVDALEAASDAQQRQLLTSALCSLTGLQLDPDSSAWQAALAN